MLKRVMWAAIAVALSMPGAGISAAKAQDRDVKFVLDFISLGRHAPWYVALGKGYFKEEGLNVTILPSKGTADAIRTVVTQGAEFGFIDIPSLVAAGGAGAPVPSLRPITRSRLIACSAWIRAPISTAPRN